MPYNDKQPHIYIYIYMIDEANVIRIWSLSVPKHSNYLHRWFVYKVEKGFAGSAIVFRWAHNKRARHQCTTESSK